MDKKSMTFGIGCGILAMVALFYLVYGVQINKYRTALAESGQTSGGESLTEAELVERARLLGMVFLTEAVKDAATPAPSPDAGEVAQAVEPAIVFIDVEIQDGLYSSEICKLLEDKGVVADGDAFDDYIVNQGCSKRLAYGSFSLPAGGDYHILLEMIRKR